jgi:hypothetical protein
MGNINYGLEANCRPLLETALGLSAGCLGLFLLTWLVTTFNNMKKPGSAAVMGAKQDEEEVKKSTKSWMLVSTVFSSICITICLILFVISQTVGGLFTKCSVTGQTHMGDDGNWYNGTGTRVSGLFQNGTGTISKWNATGNGFDWINATTIAVKPVLHAEAISTLVFLSAYGAIMSVYLLAMGYRACGYSK